MLAIDCLFCLARISQIACIIDELMDASIILVKGSKILRSYGDLKFLFTISSKTPFLF